MLDQMDNRRLAESFWQDRCPTGRDGAYNHRPFAACDETEAVAGMALDADLSS